MNVTKHHQRKKNPVNGFVTRLKMMSTMSHFIFEEVKERNDPEEKLKLWPPGYKQGIYLDSLSKVASQTNFT